MANANLEKLLQEVQDTRGILKSAKAFVEGVPALIQAAVDQAIANGATAAELEPLTALATELEGDAEAVASAIAAHGSGQPPAEPPPVG